MQTIKKIESRIEVTASGAKRIVHRKIIIKPTDPNYQEELEKKNAFLAAKNKKDFVKC